MASKAARCAELAGMVRLVRAGEMAHEQAQVQAVEFLRGKPSDLLRRTAEACHSAVDLKDGGHRAPKGTRERRPSVILPAGREHGQEVVCHELRFITWHQPMKHGDNGPGAEGDP